MAAPLPKIAPSPVTTTTNAAAPSHPSGNSPQIASNAAHRRAVTGPRPPVPLAIPTGKFAKPTILWGKKPLHSSKRFESLLGISQPQPLVDAPLPLLPLSPLPPTSTSLLPLLSLSSSSASVNVLSSADLHRPVAVVPVESLTSSHRPAISISAKLPPTSEPRDPLFRAAEMYRSSFSTSI